MLPIRAPYECGIHGCPEVRVLGDDSAVGLDAGRGTTRVTSVASALHPVEIRASGATASITEHCNGLIRVKPSISHAASLAEATPEV
jgi:hypothetical protein